jgi:kynurenine formamidase
MIDLTHAFDEKTIYWPTEKGFQLDRGQPGYTEKGYYYAAFRFRAAEHGGTHLDAPIHFFAKRQTADQVPLQRLVAPGVVVDVSGQCAEDPDYQVSVGDLRRWEEREGRTLTDVIVLLKTGYAARWPNRQAYLGTGEFGPEAVRELHFPGLHPDAARWLVDHRAVAAVGIDTASIDYGQSTHFESHVTLFEHNVPVFENVDLSRELPTQFLVAALPMKIGGGSGGPLRIVAIEMEGE